ncbi:MAG: BrnA antitoxin family protein [Rhodoferax sp.]|nr:BrnA antitoxin family protein [Rhodoferax sp.]
MPNWAAVIAQAPGVDRPLTTQELAQWDGAVLVSGGYQAARAAVAAKRKLGRRGTQRSPVKQLVSVRYSPEVLAYSKSDGAGWQTRMDEALKPWVFAHASKSAWLPAKT